MEEQRQRQEDEARRVAVASAAEAGIASPAADGVNILPILLQKRHFTPSGSVFTQCVFPSFCSRV